MRKCIECDRIITGRADKKYCDDYCRSAYHNRKYRADNKELDGINSILKNNRKILATKYVDQLSLVSRTDLVAEGYDFRYATSIEDYKEYTCKYCYDYGIVSLGASMCGVVMKDG